MYQIAADQLTLGEMICRLRCIFAVIVHNFALNPALFLREFVILNNLALQKLSIPTKNG